MTLKFDLSLINDETGENTSITGELSNIEVQILEDFVKEATQVWQTDFIQFGEQGQLNIQSKNGSDLEFKTILPDWNQVMVFLHRFRPILLQNERTNFYKIHNLLAKKLDHPQFRFSLGVQHDRFSGKVSQSRFQIKSNEVVLNSEKVLFDWLNSHEYHREESKRLFIESLHQMFPLEASKVLFLGLLIDKAVASKNVANIIQVVLGKEKEIQILMERP